VLALARVAGVAAVAQRQRRPVGGVAKSRARAAAARVDRRRHWPAAAATLADWRELPVASAAAWTECVVTSSTLASWPCEPPPVPPKKKVAHAVSPPSPTECGVQNGAGLHRRRCSLFVRLTAIAAGFLPRQARGPRSSITGYYLTLFFQRSWAQSSLGVPIWQFGEVFR